MTYQPATAPTLTAMDFAILDHLPEAGTKLGFMDLAPQVTQIVDALNKQMPPGAPKITGAAVSGRIRNLTRWDFVKAVNVTPTSGGRGFQVTTKGLDLLAAQS